MARRKKTLRKGFRKGYSLSRMIIEELAMHWVTRRNSLSRIAIEFYRGGEDKEIAEKKRLNALQQVRNILNHLQRKALIYIVPRRLVVNVPRLLYLYHVNLPEEAKKDVKEAIDTEKHKNALHMAALAFQENLGISFPLSEAYEITRNIVRMYYEKFHGYLVVLDEFTDKARNMITKINRPDTNAYFNNRVLELVSRYLLDIVAMIRYEEFIDELLGLVREVVSYKEVLEVREMWLLLTDKIRALSDDMDFRTASYARQFLEVSADADIVTSVSLL